MEDGNDLDAIEKAIITAQMEKERPSLIAVRTHIGYGSPNKQDSAEVHGEPLGSDEIKLTKKRLGWPPEPPFFIPDDALKNFREAVKTGAELENQWKTLFDAYSETYPELASEWKQWMNPQLPEGWDKGIPFFPSDPKGVATRAVSGTVLNAIAKALPNLIGGSADLAPSNKTEIKGEEFFQKDCYHGRNFHFGVREHGMGSILSGIALHGGLIPYGGTFLVFSDYMRPSIRLAAMMGLRVIYVFTHDSIGLGEDGPTHQPIEQLAALRAIPNLTVIRPADANETAEAWRFALSNNKGPVALALTRQGLPVLDREEFSSAKGLHKGAYILRDCGEGNPDIILMASGSEVALAVDAAQTIEEKNISVRIVSMPSQELFDKQPDEYREKVLPSKIKARISIEAGSPQGWHRYVGEKGDVIGLDHFGASAPYKILYQQFGLTADSIVEKALDLLRKD